MWSPSCYFDQHVFNEIDTKTILPKYEGSCMVYRPDWYHRQQCYQIPYLTGMKKKLKSST